MDSGIPLWLDIKPEYIDENIAKVLEYLQKCSHSPEDRNDSFYSTTLSLLKSRAEEKLGQLDATPLYKCYEKENEEAKAGNCDEESEICLKVFGAYLLISSEENDSLALRATLAFLGILISMVPDTIVDDLYFLALERLCGKSRIFFDWDDIIDLKPQVLASKIIAGKETCTSAKEFKYEGKGCVTISEKGLSVCSLPPDDIQRRSQVPVFSVSEGMLNALSEKSDKLSKNLSRDIEALDYFTTTYVRGFKSLPLRSRQKKTYVSGDFLEVEVTGKHNACLQVKSVDPDYETVKGEVKFLPPLKTFLYYSESDFVKNLRTGDRIEARLVDGHLEIAEAFIKAVVEGYRGYSDSFMCKVLNVKKDKAGNDKITFWSELGFPAYANAGGGSEISPGDLAMVHIVSFGKDKYYGIINVEIEEFLPPESRYDQDADLLDDAETKAAMIREDYVISASENAGWHEEAETCVDKGLLKDVCRLILSFQKTLTVPHEKFALLCFARILAEVAEYRADIDYLEFLADYLADIAHFARGEQHLMKPVSKPESLADSAMLDKRVDLATVLGTYGCSDKNEWLDGVIDSASEPVLKKVAILVQSSNRLQDFISKPMKDVIKREIVKTLSIDEGENADFDKGNGVYLGMESDRQEFKSSFFTAPSSAKEQRQPVTIMKGVCAFLNSEEGGTMYLGVNDMGYVCGIDEDLEYLDTKVRQSYSGPDGLVRYITDYVKDTFGIDVAYYVSVRPMYDAQAVMLEIKPADRIVELDGIPYIRLNSETVKMSGLLRKSLERKRNSDRKMQM